MVVVDVGAHVGYFSLLAARKVGPNGKVFSFEPDPINYELLQRNINLNGYTNVTAVNAAVADAIGTRTLFQTTLDSGRHSTYHHGLPENGSVEVDTWTLDTFLESKDWPTVDLVKVDVEGAEVDVLNGMTVLLEKMSEIQLIVEFNPALLESAGVESFAFIEKLTSTGLRIAFINEQHGIIPLEDMNIKDLVTVLLKDGSSVNLHCSPA
jgi:FkbM family methyltransferase